MTIARGKTRVHVRLARYELDTLDRRRALFGLTRSQYAQAMLAGSLPPLAEQGDVAPEDVRHALYGHSEDGLRRDVTVRLVCGQEGVRALRAQARLEGTSVSDLVGRRASSGRTFFGARADMGTEMSDALLHVCDLGRMVDALGAAVRTAEGAAARGDDGEAWRALDEAEGHARNVIAFDYRYEDMREVLENGFRPEEEDRRRAADVVGEGGGGGSPARCGGGDPARRVDQEGDSRAAEGRGAGRSVTVNVSRVEADAMREAAEWLSLTPGAWALVSSTPMYPEYRPFDVASGVDLSLELVQQAAHLSQATRSAHAIALTTEDCELAERAECVAALADEIEEYALSLRAPLLERMRRSKVAIR